MKTADVVLELERHTALGHAYVAQFKLDEPADQFVGADDRCIIDLALTPRPLGARGQYSRWWQANRYERLGKVWLAPPHEPLRFKSNPGVTRCVQCILRQSAVSSWMGEALDWNADSLEQGFDLANDSIPRLLRQIAAELSAPGFATDMMIELLQGQLAIEIGRHLQRNHGRNDGQGLPSWRLRAIEERLEEEEAAPTLAELARICGLSVRQLTRGFRTSTGRSIGETIAARRAVLAKELLASDTPIKIIAYRLGFSSPSAFNQAFHKATGEAPGAYRIRAMDGPPNDMARN